MASVKMTRIYTRAGVQYNVGQVVHDFDPDTVRLLTKEHSPPSARLYDPEKPDKADSRIADGEYLAGVVGTIGDPLDGLPPTGNALKRGDVDADGNVVGETPATKAATPRPARTRTRTRTAAPTAPATGGPAGE